VFIVGNASFVPANYDSTTDSCSAKIGSITSWTAFTFTSLYPVFVVLATSPLNADYWYPFSSDLYLYSGNLNGNPPDTCTNLLQIGDYDVGGRLTIGANYTVLIADDSNSPSLPYSGSAVHVFLFTGPYVNTAEFVVPPLTKNVTTTSSTSTGSHLSSTSTTGAVVTSGMTSGVKATSTTGITTISSSVASSGSRTFMSVFVFLLWTLVSLF